MGDDFLKQESLKNKNYVYSEKTIEVYNILNDYINSNLSFNKKLEYNLDELKRLSIFDELDYNTDVFELLFQNNKLLYNIVRAVIIFYFYQIRNNKMAELIDSEFILSLLDFYQALYHDDIEKIELFLRVANGDKEARNKVILDNKGLVCELAFKYSFCNLDIDDLTSEGMLGLIHAVDNFNIFENVQFSTYAFNCIEGFIKRFISTKEGNIKVHMANKLLNYSKSVKLLEEKLGRNPSFDEIETVFKINKSDICLLNSLKDDFISLNNFITNDGGESPTELVDLIADAPIQFIDSDVDDKNTLLYEFLYSSNLPINYIYVLIYRFGLEGADRLTLEKIGKLVGIVPDGVRQLETKALIKIRENINSYNCTDNLFSDNMLFAKNKYSTYQIFCAYKSKIIRNMPISILNGIVKNIVHYSLCNNCYLLEKKKQKEYEDIKFSKIDNKILDIFSSYILEYDKISIYDSLMDLNFEEIKIAYLNYDDSTNPKHLFVNENFNKIEKDTFFKLFASVVKNIKVSSLIFADFYKYFSSYTVEQVDKAIDKLSEDAKLLLHLRFGNDLNSKVIYPLTKVQRNKLESVIKKIDVALIHENMVENLVSSKNKIANMGMPVFIDNVASMKKEDNNYINKAFEGNYIISQIIECLINNKFDEADVWLNKYLRENEILKYESVIKSLIDIELINNKNTFENLTSVLNGINNGYNISELFDCMRYMVYFNQSLNNNDTEVAKLYLDIICFMNKVEKEKTFSYTQIEELKMRLIECEKNNKKNLTLK